MTEIAPLVPDEKPLIGPKICIMGMGGTGKTYSLGTLCDWADKKVASGSGVRSVSIIFSGTWYSKEVRNPVDDPLRGGDGGHGGRRRGVVGVATGQGAGSVRVCHGDVHYSRGVRRRHSQESRRAQEGHGRRGEAAERDLSRRGEVET